MGSLRLVGPWGQAGVGEGEDGGAGGRGDGEGFARIIELACEFAEDGP